MQSEDTLLSECFIWHWNTFPSLRKLLFHIPNEGNRGKLGGAVMKAKGVVAGVSDFIYLHPNGAYLLEAKTETGKQSPSQKEWQSVVTNAGYVYLVFRTLEEFQEIIQKIHDKNL